MSSAEELARILEKGIDCACLDSCDSCPLNLRYHDGLNCCYELQGIVDRLRVELKRRDNGSAFNEATIPAIPRGR